MRRWRARHLLLERSYQNDRTDSCIGLACSNSIAEGQRTLFLHPNITDLNGNVIHLTLSLRITIHAGVTLDLHGTDLHAAVCLKVIARRCFEHDLVHLKRILSVMMMKGDVAVLHVDSIGVNGSIDGKTAAIRCDYSPLFSCADLASQGKISASVIQGSDYSQVVVVALPAGTRQKDQSIRHKCKISSKARIISA